MRVARPVCSGVLLLDKPSGMTSHDVVGRVRRIFGQREVGHTGTLDPMATGLLVLTLGRATRLGRFLEAADKRYFGTVRLGRATTTYDAEGETTEEGSIDGIDVARIERALGSLTGRITQRVPAFSAVKVDGERLYARARRGEVTEGPAREVVVHALTLERWATPDLIIGAHVSKGTYIRSLAVQIGAALGVPAHLAALRRTRVGPHGVEAAKTLETLEGVEGELLGMTEALSHLPRLELEGARVDDVRHGRPLLAGALGPELLAAAGAFHAGDPVLLLSRSGELLAVGQAEADADEVRSVEPDFRVFSYACVLAAGGGPER